MDRAKKARTPFRTALTRTMREIDDELQKADRDLDVLRDKLAKLETLEIKLTETDNKVLDEMLDADVDDDAYQAEHDSIEKYQDDFRRIKFAVSKVYLPGSQESVHVPSSAASISGNKQRSYKLPKIEMKKFSGELKDWLGWWAQFQKIDEDEDLCPTDKFQYLLQSTIEGTRARRLVEGYPQSAANYPKVIEALKDRFGDKTLLTELYVRNLAKLVIANATKSRKTNSVGTMFDELESSLRALESLGVMTDQSAAFLYPLVESSLPDELIRVWQRSPLSGYDDEEDKPVERRLESLMKFLKKEVKGAERLSFVQAGIETSSSSFPRDKRKPHQEVRNPMDDAPTAAGLFVGEKTLCIFCDKAHDSKDCSKAITMSLQDKKSKVDNSKCCFACLKPNHGIKKCKAFIRCPVCDKRHLIVLCPQLSQVRNSTAGRSVSSSNPVSNEVESQRTVSAVACTGSVYLQTMKIKLKGPNGEKVVRALIDSGSQKSYILNSTASELGLSTISKQPLVHSLFGGGSTEVNMHNLHEVEVNSVVNNQSLLFNLLGHDKICSFLPPIRRGPWIKSLKTKRIWLSDLTPGSLEIEVLFGADSAANLLSGPSIPILDDLIAVNTRLGWTVMGRAEDSQNSVSQSMLVVNSYLNSVELDQLWKLESIGISDPVQTFDQRTKEDQAKEKLIQTISRKSNGTYVVKLPWISTSHSIPNNKAVAFKRLESTTAKLRTTGKFDDYGKIFLSWLEEGLIEIISNNEAHSFYLPHRPVYKPESTTTPIRPVFDGSCKNGRNPSLNQCLEKGPNLLEVIPSILLRFRRRKVGSIADIRKAYQTIEVCTEDRDFLRFLWWREDGQLLTYRHCKVTFGVNCSAFILGAVLEYHLRKVNHDEKLFADNLLQSMYVDNSVTSLDSHDEYLEFKKKSTEILARANMELRQWECSSVEGSRVGLLSGSGCGLETGREASNSLSIPSSTNVLGLKWNKTQDTLACNIPTSISEDVIVTKREILSTVAKIFDPIGFLCPVLIVPKVMLQEIWTLQKGWDEDIPAELKNKFISWRRNIGQLSQIQIPRFAFYGESIDGSLQLHTFSDASKFAYAAAVFIRVEHGNSVEVQLLQAKSRVAPMKNPTIPRLELLGCLIGSRLCKSVQDSLNLQDIPKYYWTDSSVALAWIQRNDDWGTFIGNRVKEINSLSNENDWRHISGINNPADLPSRGCSPSQLLQSRWWEGPEWLRRNIEDWPVDITEPDENLIQSERKKVPSLTLLNSSSTNPWYARYSSYNKNLRQFAYIKRFVSKCLRKTVESGKLTVSELKDAELHMFMLVQRESFPPNKDIIEGVRVQISNQGIYRVTTKLLHKQDTEEFKFPVLLPTTHPLTDQLVRHVHESNGHMGVQWLMSSLREKVWILKSRQVIKGIIGKCVICRRFLTKPPGVPFAPLPEDRVGNSRVFEVTGVDLAGPLFLKNRSKAWIVIFTCAVYRAVHFEFVQSLSTEAFLIVFQKFICRRGRPSIIYSDNGTNFRGSDNLFKSIDWNLIEDYAAIRRIRWKFNPPSGAWWGGWWERLIGYAKAILRRMLGFQKVTANQFESLLCEVESSMNCRPLTYVSDDQEDLIPLTPQMFLSELPSSIFPEGAEIDSRSLQRSYQSLGKLRMELKERFRREYLSQLVHRGKSRKIVDFQIGDVVLLGDDQKKRIFWPMGRILELFTGADGKTRVAKIRVKGGDLTRPLQRLYPLEISSAKEIPDIPMEVMEKALKTERQEKDEPVVVTRYGRRVKKPSYYQN